MFITFEGIDGSGKSTQIERLKEHVEKEGTQVSVLRDPGGPEVAERVREILLNPELEINPVTELLLFSAARSQLVTEAILPKLERGQVVLLDRFYDSTTAYQGYGRESVALEEIKRINELASHGRQPDLTIYMQIPYKDAKKRMARKNKDRMEQAGELFYQKVIAGFEKLAESEDRFIAIDAMQPVDQVDAQIWRKVQPLLSQN